jgi:hypothetical protein
VKLPQLVIASATFIDGAAYPLVGGEVRFGLALTRGNEVTGWNGPGESGAFATVLNWSIGKARPLHVKLRVGDRLDVCWVTGTLVRDGRRGSCITHTFVKADRATPYQYRFDLVRPPGGLA